MTVWLRIETNPALQIGGGSDNLAARDDATVTVGSIDLGSASGNASAQATISDANAETRRALRLAAVGAVVTIYNDSDEIYSGTVDSLTAGVQSRQISLQVQS